MKKAVLGIVLGLVALGLLQWASPMLPLLGGYSFDLSPNGVARFIGIVKAHALRMNWLVGGEERSSEHGGEERSSEHGGEGHSSEHGGEGHSSEQGRPLGIRITTALGAPNAVYTREMVVRLQSIANGFISSPRAYARDDGILLLVFDVQKGRPIQAVTQRTLNARDVIDGHITDNETIVTGAKLLVRLFDRNGQYLTHFITEEVFSFYTTVTGRESFMVKGEKTARHTCDEKGCIRLQSEGNRLTYAVNQRDLDYTAYVEAGFWVYSIRSPSQFFPLTPRY